jgi:hypothetical protein
MSALQRVREKFGNTDGVTDKTARSSTEVWETPRASTDRTDKSPSASSVSANYMDCKKFAALSADLEQRIRSMASRWKYSPDELADALAAARTNTAAWLSAVDFDERLHAKLTRAGLPTLVAS